MMAVINRIKKIVSAKSSGLLMFVVAATLVFTSFSVRTYAADIDIIAGLQDLLTAALGGDDDAAAEFRDSICYPTKQMYEAIMADQTQASIVRTHYFITAAAPLNAFYTLTGASIDMIPRCAPVVGESINAMCELDEAAATHDSLWGLITSIGGTLEELLNGDPIEGCEGISMIFSPTQAISRGPGGPKNTSLAGLAASLSAYQEVADPSVSLAYYINDSVSRIPVIGATLAADPLNTDYRGIFLSQIVTAWKLVRNISYGLLSLYLFYVGFLIITRRSVDQRTIVTIQYALPKLVMAVFLITFSYAIGASVAEGSWFLSRNVRSMISEAFFGDNWGIMELVSIIGFLVLSVILIPFTLGGNLLSIGIMILIVGVVGIIIFEVKFYILYVKIIIAIITGPLELLMGSIPGSKEGVSRWFKKILAYGLGMISMRAILALTYYVGLAILFESFDGGGDIVSTIQDLSFGVFFASFLFPLVIIMGCFQGMKAPKAIETALLGKKR